MASGIFVPELRSLGKETAGESPSGKIPSVTSANIKTIVGIQFHMLTEKVRKGHDLPDLQGGVEITKVIPASPAAHSGLQVGDVIRKVDGTILKSVNDLEGRVDRMKPGQPLQLEVWRNGRPFDVTITTVNGFDLFEESCGKGEAEGCLELGYLYAELKDPLYKQRAFASYKKSCEIGLAVACYNVAIAYRDGTGVDKDSVRAIALLKESCEGNYFDACSALGFAYEEGTEAEKDIIKASSFYKKACDGGSFLGCSNLGVNFRDGIGEEKDPIQAAKLFDRACDGGLAMGCNLLGALYQQGEGVPRDTLRAAKLYTQACSDGNSESCENLAALLEAGDGVPKDITQAKTLYDKACEEGQGWSCYRLGSLFNQDGPDKDPSQAMSFYQRGCDLGEPAACNNQGVMYEHGRGVEVDKIKAAELYEKACDNNATACDNRGLLSVRASDAAKAELFFNKACDKNLGKGCAHLADFYETQKRSERKVDVRIGYARMRAMFAYQKECDSGDYSSCFNLALLYEPGKGLIQNGKNKSLGLYEKACAEGNLQEACDKIRRPAG